MAYLKAAVSALFFMGAATAAVAQPAGGGGDGQAVQQLRSALHVAVTNGDDPPGQSKRPNDPDMGDDNASMRAITEVCTKDTPAAERSAICDESASPN